MASLQSMQNLFDGAKPFASTVPQSLFPYLAFILLVGAFVLTGIFSIIPPKTSIAQEVVTGAAASALAGFGVIFLFLSVGIYVTNCAMNKLLRKRQTLTVTLNWAYEDSYGIKHYRDLAITWYE